jgi:hypothetical protein
MAEYLPGYVRPGFKSPVPPKKEKKHMGRVIFKLKNPCDTGDIRVRHIVLDAKFTLLSLEKGLIRAETPLCLHWVTVNENETS